MAFTKSTVTVTNISDLADQPAISAAALKAKFDLYGSDDKTYVNALIDELEDATNGTSGSDSLGMTELANNGSATETAQAQVEALDTAIGDRTYTEQNYITDAEAIAASLDALDQQAKDENDASVKVTGNQTIAGIKTFSSLPVIPETPTNDTHAASKGYVDTQSPLTIPNNSLTELKMAAEMKKQAGGVATYEMGLTSKQLGGGYLINPDFGVNQREVSGSVVLAQDEYGHDRFKGGASGCTYTFATSGGVTTLTISAGSLIQEIEGENLDSDTYVLSWEGTAQGKIGAGSFDDSGITEAVTGGSDLSIEFNTGTLAKCKLEIGSVPTSFVQKSFTEELRDCQRYYYSILYQDTDASERFSVGQCIATTSALIHIGFPQSMRIDPTLINSGDFSLSAVTGSNIAVTSMSLASSSRNTAILTVGVASGIVAGNATTLRRITDATARISFDAEL